MHHIQKPIPTYPHTPYTTENVYDNTNLVIHTQNNNPYTQPNRLATRRKAESPNGESKTRAKQDAEGQNHKHNSHEQLLCPTSPIHKKTHIKSHNSLKATNHQQHAPHINPKNKENTRQQLTKLQKDIEEERTEKPSLDQHPDCEIKRPKPKHTTRTSHKNTTQGLGPILIPNTTEQQQALMK
jgi:hypothetical protein